MGKRYESAALTAIAVSGLLAITGCAGSSDGEPEATASSEAPVEADFQASCEEFEVLSERTADAIVSAWNEDDADAAELEALPEEFDMLALQTDGTVGERMQAAADVVLDEPLMTMSLNPDDYFDAIRAVQRACEVEGATIGVATWN